MFDPCHNKFVQGIRDGMLLCTWVMAMIIFCRVCVNVAPQNTKETSAQTHNSSTTPSSKQASAD